MKQYWLLLFCLFSPALFGMDQSFISLCYHNVKDTWDDDPMTVETNRLINQFAWLREHHYHPVSLQAILDAQKGLKPLPEKAVLLTFDDGYRNFYHRIYPILKQFNYPAIFALVTSWMETPTEQPVHYGNELKPRSDFLTWEQVSEMMDSGLIEIASHSHDLHHGILGNKQGNTQPAATTRQYFPDLKRYETEEQYRQRIRQDLQTSSDIIFTHTGKRPRVIVWPYGEYSLETNTLASQVGLKISVGLGNGLNALSNNTHIQRHLIMDNPALADFVYALRHLLIEQEPVRVAHIDMDYIYDDNPEQIRRNLSKLLDRIKALRINTVYLQAFADPDGDGNANALYFPNRRMPVRADLFNRVAWQLRTRAGVSVYAWLPVLAFEADLPQDWWVHEWKAGKAIPSQNNYHRLSPFHPLARRFIKDIYQDLARYNHFAGLLFHDDALLTDFEDASPAAQVQMANLNKAEKTRLKINVLTSFTESLADTVRFYRPEIKTARNLYATVIMQPESQEWFAQSFENFINHYDYVAVMAMPYMENAKHPNKWLTELVDNIEKKHPDALKKTVFELQSVDWRVSQKIPSEKLKQQMSLLQQKNALNYGYYPDDFYQNQPAFSMLKEMMSLETFPYGI
jgi:biofilm PGA synthesis lipoprotein PgaB